MDCMSIKLLLLMNCSLPGGLGFYEISLSQNGAFLANGNMKHFPQKSFVVTPTGTV